MALSFKSDDSRRNASDESAASRPSSEPVTRHGLPGITNCLGSDQATRVRIAASCVP